MAELRDEARAMDLAVPGRNWNWAKAPKGCAGNSGRHSRIRAQNR